MLHPGSNLASSAPHALQGVNFSQAVVVITLHYVTHYINIQHSTMQWGLVAKDLHANLARIFIWLVAAG